jgi:hypothetical protein
MFLPSIESSLPEVTRSVPKEPRTIPRMKKTTTRALETALLSRENFRNEVRPFQDRDKVFSHLGCEKKAGMEGLTTIKLIGNFRRLSLPNLIANG